jgi:hypothetical protein
MQKARRDVREGKSASTAAGEFVREEIDHIREGKHGARSSKQAIAIGLSKARRAGVQLKAPKKGATSESTRRSAERDYETGQGKRKPRAPSAKRSRATRAALAREPRKAASPDALRRQAKRAAAARRARGTTVSPATPRRRSQPKKTAKTGARRAGTRRTGAKRAARGARRSTGTSR